jgi:hypothetical protein
VVVVGVADAARARLAGPAEKRSNAMRGRVMPGFGWAHFAAEDRPVECIMGPLERSIEKPIEIRSCELKPLDADLSRLVQMEAGFVGA